MSTNLEAVEVRLHVERELISIMRTVAISGSWDRTSAMTSARRDFLRSNRLYPFFHSNDKITQRKTSFSTSEQI